MVPGGWDSEDIHVEPLEELPSENVHDHRTLDEEDTVDVSDATFIVGELTDSDTESLFSGNSSETSDRRRERSLSSKSSSEKPDRGRHHSPSSGNSSETSDRRREDSSGEQRVIEAANHLSGEDALTSAKYKGVKCDKSKLQSSPTVAIDITDATPDDLGAGLKHQANGTSGSSADATTPAENDEKSTFQSTIPDKVSHDLPNIPAEESNLDLRELLQALEQEITDLKLENQILNAMLAYSSSASNHQTGIINWLDTMYAERQIEDVTTLNSPLLPPEPPSTTWIRGTWLSVSSSFPELRDAEEQFRLGRYEDGSFLVSKIIIAHQYEVSELLLHAKLLRGAIMRAHGDIKGSLYSLEDTLDLANQGLIHLSGKVQFQRGMTFLGLEEWAKARFCFSMAVGACGYEEMIAANRSIADRNHKELPMGHEAKGLPWGFR